MSSRKSSQQRLSLVLIVLLLAGCSGTPAKPTATPSPVLPTPTPTPGIPFSKDKAVPIQSISSIEGQGEASFTKGDQAETLLAHVNGMIPVVNGKTCFYCVATIKIGPNLKVSLNTFFMERPSQGKSIILNDFGTIGPMVSEGDTEFILSGPNGATLRKEGNGFFLVDGEAYFVQATSP